MAGELSRRLFFVIPGLVVVSAATEGCEANPEPSTQPEVPQAELIRRYLEMERRGFTELPYESRLIGANWQEPANNAEVPLAPFTLATTAFANDVPGASPIDLVALTVNLPPDPELVERGLQRPDSWRILGVFPADQSNLYTVIVNPSALGVTASRELRFGADVVNKNNQRKRSPNGPRTVHIK